MRRGSVVSWGELWEVACLRVGEVKCLGANIFSAKSAKGQSKKSWKRPKRENKKTRHFQNFEYHTFLRKDMQARILTE